MWSQVQLGLNTCRPFGCGPLLLLTSLLIVIMWWSFIFTWPTLLACVCLTGKKSLAEDLPLLFYTPRLLLVYSPPLGPQASSGGKIIVRWLCSLSGSSQATEVFSQSRHLLCCAALFSGDVMSCGKSHPYQKCTVEGWSGVLVNRRRLGWWLEIPTMGTGRGAIEKKID